MLRAAGWPVPSRGLRNERSSAVAAAATRAGERARGLAAREEHIARGAGVERVAHARTAVAYTVARAVFGAPVVRERASRATPANVAAARAGHAVTATPAVVVGTAGGLEVSGRFQIGR